MKLTEKRKISLVESWEAHKQYNEQLKSCETIMGKSCPLERFFNELKQEIEKGEKQ